jgi:RimJ/RimL family protein N-acetyltransferase
MMQGIDLVCGYKIKHLSKDYNNTVVRLCEKCSDYFILCDGEFPSKEKIDKIFTDIPPNKKFDDKYILGVYNSDELVGIVDIIKDFPTIGEWVLGLMLLAPEERGNGLGKTIHEALVVWAKQQGAKTFRIGVIEDNYKAFNFWSNLGYTKIREINMDFSSKAHIVNIMRLQI